MRAVTWHGKREVRVSDCPDPRIEQPTDAVIRVTSTAICGSDLHLYEVLGMFMNAGDILGHEAMGIVEEVGSDVPHLTPGDHESYTPNARRLKSKSRRREPPSSATRPFTGGCPEVRPNICEFRKPSSDRSWSRKVLPMTDSSSYQTSCPRHGRQSNIPMSLREARSLSSGWVPWGIFAPVSPGSRTIG
jgi:hypothetical protein